MIIIERVQVAKRTPWNDEDTKLAQDMRKLNMRYRDIGDRLGRSAVSVESRLRIIAFSEEQLRNYRASKHKYDKSTRHRKRNDDGSRYVASAERPPHEVLIEREMRLSCERTISQSLFGDPLPGQSALDRRTQGAPQ